jgi:hypothetical protein
VEGVIVTSRAKTFGMDRELPFATLAGKYFWLEVEFFVTTITKTFGMVLFFLLAVITLFYHQLLERSHIKTLC